MMEMGLAFGLRRKEQLKLKPWHAIQAGYLHLDGSITKGGRFRAVLIETGEYGDLQKGALAKAKHWCKKNEALGWPGLTFEQSVNRYKHLVRRLGFSKENLGVCMHGLRAEYVENMAMLRGLLPPSLGGSVNQMPKEQRVEITTAVSGLMGHGPGGHTIGAYFGTFVNYKKVSGLGGMVGPIILDAAGELVAQIYCNPALVKGTDGNYRNQSEAEIAQVVINAVIFKGGEETEKLTLREFLEKHGATGGNRLQLMLEARGLTK